MSRLAPWLAVCLALGTTFAHAKDAEPPPPAWQGVWQGTIGEAAVQACFQHEGYGDFGAYYYMRHLGIITLGTIPAEAKAEAVPIWTESPDAALVTAGPFWHLNTLSRDHMQGVWKGGGKTLPVDLTRVAIPSADDSEDQPCGSDAFSLPRFTKPVITTKPAMLDGIAYTRIIVDPGPQFSDYEFETFQLNGSTPAIQRVNTELYKTVPTSPDADYFQCSMEALSHSGRDGESSSTQTPLIISKSWLVMEDGEYGYCGGPYPASAVNYQTWDLRSGSLINLHDWFNDQALKQAVHEPGTVDQYITVTVTAPFKKMIDEAYPHYDDDADCQVARQDADSWSVHLTATGVDFMPELPHVVQACIDDAILPFAKLEPYLSPAGKVGVASFTAEVKPAP